MLSPHPERGSGMSALQQVLSPVGSPTMALRTGRLNASVDGSAAKQSEDGQRES